MRYYGSKTLVAGDIYKVICKYEKARFGNNATKYFEPFVGGFNMARVVCAGPERKKVIVCDLNKDIIEMYKAIQDGGWEPPDELMRVDYDEYMKYKRARNHTPERAFVGVAFSQYGQFFSKYVPSKYSYILKKEVRALGELFEHTPHLEIMPAMPYDQFAPKNCVVYCDPPYRRTDYKHEFDTDIFWEVMRAWSKNNLVFVSEEEAPPDFKCIWSAEIVKRNASGRVVARIDRLFIHGDPK